MAQSRQDYDLFGVSYSCSHKCTFASSCVIYAFFDPITIGVCPHDEGSILDPVKTKGIGIKLVCSKCGHTWYINKKIKTCGCLTCKGMKRDSMERVRANRVGRNNVKKEWWALLHDR